MQLSALIMVLVFSVILGSRVLSPAPQLANSTISSTSIPTKAPLPTSTPTPTPVPPTPTSVPIVIPTVQIAQPTAIPQPTSAPVVSSSSVQDMILNQVNQYRQSKGLGAVSADSNTCSFANIRAQEISSSFSHDGFQNRINSNTLPYPGYSEITENLAMNSDSNDVVNSWINSPGHAANMERNTPHVCIGISGNYYAYEGWKP